MRWLPLLTAALLAAAPALAEIATDASPPTRLVVSADPPDPLPAGARQTIEVTVQRQARGQPAPGPGEVEVQTNASSAAGCSPPRQTVALDPLRARARSEVVCRPTAPGTYPVHVRARETASRPGTWNASLEVHPDSLEGTLDAGEPSAYAIPLSLRLAPRHLDSAPVDVSVHGNLSGSPLAFREPVLAATADGSTLQTDVLARHGPGDYDVTVNVTGPRTEPWTARANVHVRQPPASAQLSLNATVEPGQPSVELADDPVNEDGKAKAPGRELITRLDVEQAREVDVSVLRAEGDSGIEIARETVAVEQGRAEHVFAHEPLPVGRLWVEASVNDSAVARTAAIGDLEASAQLEGPEAVLADGRAWRADLTIEDPNFGSTSLDPGPVFGLPDLAWTVYRGSLVADGFEVAIGPFEGPSEGTASTSRVPWPQGGENVEVEPGRARLPVSVRAPPDADEGTYRLSLYAPDGDRIGGESWSLEPAPSVSLRADEPVPGGEVNASLDVERPIEGTVVDVRLLVDGDVVAERRTGGTGNLSLPLPAPLPTGTPVVLEAWADWPGRPTPSGPDDRVETTVPELPARVSLEPRLDGAPAPTPVPVHPASPHVVEVLLAAFDPNSGPANVTDVHVDGPEGSPDWEVTWNQTVAVVRVPVGSEVGRYRVIASTAGPAAANATLALDVAPTVRLSLQGPEDVRVSQGGARTVPLEVRNLGSTPLGALVLAVESDLDVQARAGNGTSWVEAGRPIGVELPPGERANVTVELRGSGEPGEGPIEITLAGVVA